MDVIGRLRREQAVESTKSRRSRRRMDDSMDGVGRVASGTKTEQLPSEGSMGLRDVTENSPLGF